jgi:hypothetical protein
MSEPINFDHERAVRDPLARHAASLALLEVPFDDSWRSFLEAIALQNPTAREKAEVMASVAAWIEACPALRFSGYSPWWRAACPFCNVPGGLWVTPDFKFWPDPGWGTECFVRDGDTPGSLTFKIGAFKARHSPLL